MKRSTAYFAIMVVLCVFFCGCTETSQPLNKYRSGDVLFVENSTGQEIYSADTGELMFEQDIAGVFIGSYNRATDEYSVKRCYVDYSNGRYDVAFITDNTTGELGPLGESVRREYFEEQYGLRLCNVPLSSTQIIYFDEAYNPPYSTLDSR